jgi:hypothetical protein
MPAIIVNNNQNVKTPKPTYYHSFKLSDSSYALFDAKMDMPIVIGSVSIIQSAKLAATPLVFDYRFNSRLFFEKQSRLYVEMNKDANGKHQKPPLRYHNIDPLGLFYHLFKLTSTTWSLFGLEFDMPIAYGSYSRIQAVLNKINPDAIVFYYHEDVTNKNSFRVWYRYANKKVKYINGK